MKSNRCMVLFWCILMILHKGASSITSSTVSVQWIFSNGLDDLAWTHGIWKGRTNVQSLLEDDYPDREFYHALANVDIEKSASEQESSIAALITNETNIVVTTSFTLTNAVQNLASSYPNISFICISGGPKPIPNVVVTNLDYYEGAYLSGYIAGAMTKTNKLGFLMGFPTAPMHQMISAYYLGAKVSNPDIKIYHIRINTWGNTSKELGAVEVLMNQGCDIITGTTKQGSYHNIEGINSLGQLYDFGNIYGDSVLASYVPKWEYVLYPLIKEAINYKEFNQSIQLFGMTDPGVPIDIGTVSLKVPKKHRQFLPELRESVVNGSNKIFCGPLRDGEGIQRVPVGYCLTDIDLNHMNYIVGENNVNMGNYEYPPDVCGAGTYYVMNTKENSHECIPCPVGTYAPLSQRDACTPCLSTDVAPGGASTCTVCPSKQEPNQDHSICVDIPIQWYIWLIIGLSLLITFVIFFAIIFIFFIIVWKLWSIVKHQRDTLKNAENVSTSIALMQLDNPTIHRFIKSNPSSHLNAQLIRIVQNLKQYRPYLPSSLFAIGDDEPNLDDVNLSNSSSTKNAIMELASVVPSPHKHIDDFHMSETSSQRSKSSQRSINRIRERLQLGLVSRVATVLVLEIKEFSRILLTTPPVHICNVFMSLTDAILPIMKSSNGVYHALIGDKLVCTWNAVSKVSNHQLHATASSLLIQDAIKNLHEKWSKSNLPLLSVVGALYTGPVNCGNLGTTKLRTFNLLGPTMDYAFALSRLNTVYNSQFLMNRDCYSVVQGDTTSFLVDQIQVSLHEGSIHVDQLDVFQLISLKACSPKLQPWMSTKHCVPKTETPSRAQSLRVYNTAIQDFYNDNLDTAKAFLEEVIRLENHAEDPIHTLLDHCRRFIHRIKNEQFHRNHLVVHSLPEYP